MSYNISDFVIRIKNAIQAKHSFVKIRNTKLNRNISYLLRTEGFINDVSFTNIKGINTAVGPLRSKSEVPYTQNRNQEEVVDPNSTSVLTLPNQDNPYVKQSEFLLLSLKYANCQQKNENAITEIKVISKPSARIYSSAKELPTVLGGLGTVIVTTSKGLMTDKKARSLNIGGELLFSIW